MRGLQCLSSTFRYFLMKLTMYKVNITTIISIIIIITIQYGLNYIIFADINLYFTIWLVQYLSNNKQTKHIKHYVRNCSLGDWFVLYQMSRFVSYGVYYMFMFTLNVKKLHYCAQEHEQSLLCRVYCASLAESEHLVFYIFLTRVSIFYNLTFNFHSYFKVVIFCHFMHLSQPVSIGHFLNWYNIRI